MVLLGHPIGSQFECPRGLAECREDLLRGDLGIGTVGKVVPGQNGRSYPVDVVACTGVGKVLFLFEEPA